MAELQQWGARMTQPPTTYTFRKRFLDGLPMALIDKMIDQGVSPDLAKLSKMVRTLQCIEENNALKDYYVKSSKKTCFKSTYFTKRLKEECKSGNYPLPKCAEDGTTIKIDSKWYQY